MKYDVIIIGAGPSGLSCAINLFKLGIKNILVVEKYEFPRYKVCAGYITDKTKKAYENLGLDISKCHYSLIDDFDIFYKLKKKQSIINKFLYTNRKIERVELDNAFYNLAKKMGIEIMQNSIIKKHDFENNLITINDKKIAYKQIVFADGYLGYGSKYQKLNKRNIAMQLITKTKRKTNIEIHFGITKKGYGWVSTYNGITNIGLTDVYNKNTNYKKIFKEFLESQNIEASVKDLRGCFTPIGIKRPIINQNMYFVGDAVGACDPITLSGLRYGIKCGELCAKSIYYKKDKIYIRYINKLRLKFKLMEVLLNIFYLRFNLFLIFNIGCKYMGSIIAKVFNNFFVNKK